MKNGADNIECLKTNAERIAERELETEQTQDGRYIVLWMSFDKAPPPKGDTEKEAWENFIQYMLNNQPEDGNLSVDNTTQEATNESGNRSFSEDDSDDTSPERSQG